MWPVDSLITARACECLRGAPLPPPRHRPRPVARARLVLTTLAARGVHVVLSNADTPLVRRLYDGFRQAQVFMPRAVNRDAAGRGPVAELLLSAGPAVASA